jgi:peptidoglycan/LPS O-acetylase OafA/YrhL
MRGRVAELDGVRGIAILLVVAAHAGGAGLSFGGGVGVTVFFVLSGYLITNLLLAEMDRTGTIAVRAFWVRRARRLIPALGLLLIAKIAIAVASGSPEVGLRSVAFVALYSGNFVRALGGGLNFLDHTWSLAVEEQFYMVWPLVVMVLARRSGPGRFAKIMVAATVAALLWRVVLVAAGADLWAYFAPDANAYALLAGAFLASVVRCGWAAPRWFGGVGLAGVVLVSVAPRLPELLVIQPFAALAGCLLIAGATRVPGLAFAPLAYLGRISYGVYLWHFPLMMGISETQIGTRWVAATVSMLVAALSFHLLEQKFVTGVTGRRSGRAQSGSVVTQLTDGPLPAGPATMPERRPDQAVITL